MVDSMPATPTNFRATRFSIIANTQIHRSPLDKSVQTLELTGARWRADYELQPMDRAEAAAWAAFLANLEGSAGRFFGFDPAAKTPLGSGVGDSPLIKGASQTGKSITTDAWTADQNGLLLPGDYFEVNGELKIVTASVDSDGSGDATIAFSPSLRASPPENDPLTLSNPTCTMHLLDGQQAGWDLGDAVLYGVAFSAIEAFS